MKQITTANYQINFTGSVLYWGVLILFFIILSIATFGIGVPFISIYLFKLMLEDITISKNEATKDVTTD
ncbi:MAG: hypothetical protein ACRC5T_10035 [Cetobacterium sp.]